MKGLAIGTILIGCTALSLWLLAVPQQDARFEALEARLVELEEASPGRLGVYLLRPADGSEMNYQADRPWYLASATKAPVAIAVLQAVDEGQLTLEQSIELQKNDQVDGSGGLVWEDAGTRYSVRELLEEMLQESDNTAANMLIRTLGEDELNRRIADAAGSEFGTITTLRQVRHELYGQLHADARSLETAQLIEIAAAPLGPQRVEAVANALNLAVDQLDTQDLDEAYRRYYDTGLNSAPLSAYGQLLAKLADGDLLSAESTELLYGVMGLDTYDAYRLEAGLASDVPFIQKTGTQQHRACHVGIAYPQSDDALVIVACAEALDENDEAGRLFEQVGEAIQSLALDTPAASS